MMVDSIYQNIQYPLMKIINTLRNLENIDSLIPEHLAVEARDEVIQEIKDFIEFWEDDGRDTLKNLINQLRNKS